MNTKASHKFRGILSANRRRERTYRPLFEILESRLALATVFGVTSANALVQFDSATPGTISAPTAITGLMAGETVVGIDFRPATGLLYGVTNQSQIYTINVSTGAATLVAPLTNAVGGGPVTLSGTAFGVDFNPVPDRLRIVSDAEQNLRVNAANGVTNVDVTLAYDDTTADGDPIDPNAGQNPNVVDAAYINSFAGATATTLFGIDTALDILVIQNPPNNGVLNTVGSLGINAVDVGGFDILAQAGSSNAAFAALSTNGTSSGFYTINLTTGAATLVGNVGATPTLLNGIAVVPEGNLSVDKVGPVTITAGTRVIETITVTNAGPSAAFDVVLTEVLPPGIMESGFAQTSGPPATLAFNGTDTFTATIPVLAVGESAIFLVGIDVPASFSAGSAVTNTASVDSDTADPVSANDSDTVTSTIVTSADLTVTKTDSPDPVVAGTNVTYTVTITNDGPSDAQNATLTDAIPANTTFVSATQTSGPAFTLLTPPAGGTGTFTATTTTLAAGATATFELVVNVNASALQGSTISNTATVSSTATDPTPGNNTDTETTAVNAQTDLSVTKTDSPDPVAAGANLTYTITVSNIGPSNAQTVSLTDAVPTNTTFVAFTAPAGWTTSTPAPGGTGAVTASRPSFAAGATATFTFVVNVNPGTPQASILTNSVTVASGTTELDPANNTDTETTTVTGTSAQVDVSVTKDDSPDPVTAGENITYTITVTNSGPGSATGVTLSDAIPAGTAFVSFTAPAGWTTTTPPAGGPGTILATNPTVAAGDVGIFTLVVSVDAATPDGSIISNAATVIVSSGDSNLANNTDTETTDVGTLGLPECEVITFNLPGDPGTATLEDDADNPGSGALIVTGTTGNDVIVVERNPRNRSQLRVVRNGRVIGTFNSSDVQHIVAFGLAGNDKIIVNATLVQQATLFGDEGSDYLFGARGADGLEGGSGVDRLFGGSNNDTLCGGDGNDFVYGQAGNDFAGGDAGNDKVFGESGNDFLLGNDGNDHLFGGTGSDRMFGQAGNDQVFGESGNDIGVGGDGNDRLFGGSGRDVLIGGDGLDLLFGGGQDDILVAGPTVHDEDDEALQAILAEWTSTNSYTTRVNNIRFGGGANGVFTLDDTTVIDDGLKDTLWGEGGLDWFLFGSGDRLRDKAGNELVN